MSGVSSVFIPILAVYTFICECCNNEKQIEFPPRATNASKHLGYHCIERIPFQDDWRPIFCFLSQRLNALNDQYKKKALVAHKTLPIIYFYNARQVSGCLNEFEPFNAYDFSRIRFFLNINVHEFAHSFDESFRVAGSLSFTAYSADKRFVLYRINYEQAYDLHRNVNRIKHDLYDSKSLPERVIIGLYRVRHEYYVISYHTSAEPELKIGLPWNEKPFGNNFNYGLHKFKKNMKKVARKPWESLNTSAAGSDASSSTSELFTAKYTGGYSGDSGAYTCTTK